VIQSHLANGGQLCPAAADERVHLFGLIAVEKGGIQPGRGLYHGELFGKIYVSFRIRQGFTDRNDRAYSRSARSCENLAPVTIEFRAAQVGVGVDEGEANRVHLLWEVVLFLVGAASCRDGAGGSINRTRSRPEATPTE
jgi:hypothetical protein